MKNFPLVFAREFRETVRSRFFRSTSILFGAVVLLAFIGLILFRFIPSGGLTSLVPDDLVGITGGTTGGQTQYTVAIDDRSGAGFTERLSGGQTVIEYRPETLSDAAIRAVFEAGADACLIIHEDGSALYYFSPFAFDFRLSDMVRESLNQIAREDAMAVYGISPSDAAEILSTTCVMNYSEVSRTDLMTEPEDTGDSPTSGAGFEQTGASVVVYLIASMMFLSISLYGQMVSGRVMHEKHSRMIEVLASSATPAELLCGKVLGVGAAGFSQILLFYSAMLAIGAGFVSRLPGTDEIAVLLSEMLSAAGGNIAAIFIYMLLGFVLVAFIYGGLGAMSSDTETVSGFAAIPLHLPMLGYFIAMMSPFLADSAILTIASFLPILSPFAMPARICLGQAAVWEIIISMLLQLGCTACAAILSARLYRRGMLRYGQPPKLKELLRSLGK